MSIGAMAPQDQFSRFENDLNRTQRIPNVIAAENSFAATRPNLSGYSTAQNRFVPKRSMTQDNKNAMNLNEEGQLSDWDDDSGDEFDRRSKQALTNVRDRTINLSNVYHGSLLSPKGAVGGEPDSAAKWFSPQRN